jgi:hypothetical protein
MQLLGVCELGTVLALTLMILADTVGPLSNILTCLVPASSGVATRTSFSRCLHSQACSATRVWGRDNIRTAFVGNYLEKVIYAKVLKQSILRSSWIHHLSSLIPFSNSHSSVIKPSSVSIRYWRKSESCIERRVHKDCTIPQCQWIELGILLPLPAVSGKPSTPFPQILILSRLFTETSFRATSVVWRQRRQYGRSAATWLC